MNSGQLFTQALGLHPPWYVERIEFKTDSKGRKHLDIYLRIKMSSKFKEDKGQDCPVYDTLEALGNI